MSEKTWQEMVKLAEHYKAIGSTDLYLFRDVDNTARPWAYVTQVKPGSTHRLDMSTSIDFIAQHPSGLQFRWSVEIEDRDANGSGHYKVNMALLERVMTWLPEAVRPQYRDYLETCARAVNASADKYAVIEKRERDTAARLALAATATTHA